MTADLLATPPAEPGVQRLVVWRHGRTEWNLAGRFQGQLDPPLDAVGREQAARAAAILAAGLPNPGTVVVTSDLVRAVDTATALTDLLGVPLRRDPRLREHSMGLWEGLTREEVAARYPEQYAAWTAGRPVVDRGGEDPDAVSVRAHAALHDLPAAEAAVVVTHGGTAGRLIEGLLGLEPHHRRVLGPLGNCAWSELVAQGSRWRLVRHNLSAVPAVDGGPVPQRRLRAGASPEEAAPPVATDADAAG